jgi:hypothetical protein
VKLIITTRDPILLPGKHFTEQCQRKVEMSYSSQSKNVRF